MWATAIERNGGPEVLAFTELADPACAEDGVVIEVEAVSIEGGDLIARALTPLPRSPHVLGVAASGTVVEIGVGVTGRQLGERVVTLAVDGSHATRRAVPAARAWPIPEGLSTREAACVPVAFGTAFECLFTAGELQPGQTVLVHGGSGGLGMAAIQLAKLAGATVLATASHVDKLERLKAFGLDHGVDPSHPDFIAEVRKVAGPGGVDLIVDSGGGRTLAESTAVLGWRGRLVCAGPAGPAGSAVDAAALRQRCNSVHGVRLASVLDAEHARSFAMIAECLARAASGELKVQIAKVFPLAAAADAHEYIESRRAFGRVVLSPKPEVGSASPT